MTNPNNCPTHRATLDPRCPTCLEVARVQTSSELREEPLGEPVPVHPAQISLFDGGAR